MSGESCTSTYTGPSSGIIYRCGDVAGEDHSPEHETSEGDMWWKDEQANPPEPELVKLADGVAQVWLTEEQILVIGGALSMLGAEPDERMAALKLKLYGALVGLQ